MKRIILMGFMGAGKSTVGKYLAQALSVEFIDTDELIEREQKCRITDIFEKSGEQAFRDMETEVLKKLEGTSREFVLSVGGGTPVREENRLLLRKMGLVVYLETSKEEILRRVGNAKDRPMLRGEDLEKRVVFLMNEREMTYLETAHKKILTDGKKIEEVAEEIKKLLSKTEIQQD